MMEKENIPKEVSDARMQISLLEEQLKKGTLVRENEQYVQVSFGHMMEYFLYAFYFRTEKDIRMAAQPYSTYYRTEASYCLEQKKYHAAEKACQHALEWNPTDLDAIWMLAESYRFMPKLQRFLEVTKQAYRFCATRATVARYYRNLGYYYINTYQPQIARACYLYAQIYYETPNAESELQYLEEALQDKTPQMTIPQMQEIFRKNGIEPGPEPDTIRVLYQAGHELLKQGEDTMAKDCFVMVHDITQEASLEDLIHEIEKNGY